MTREPDITHASEKKKEHWSNNYHGKVLPLELAEAIIRVDQDIPLRDLEQIIPYENARNRLINAPTDVVLYECACGYASGNHCSPSRVCVVIGKPVTDFVLEHHPDKISRATKEEALAVLRDEEDRGHMHTAWFKDFNMNRFYSICNRCPCCCVGLRAMQVNGWRSLAPSGYIAVLDHTQCTDCGTCAISCPFDAITLDDKKMGLDWDKCMGCGCASANALSKHAPLFGTGERAYRWTCGKWPPNRWTYLPDACIEQKVIGPARERAEELGSLARGKIIAARWSWRTATLTSIREGSHVRYVSRTPAICCYMDLPRFLFLLRPTTILDLLLNGLCSQCQIPTAQQCHVLEAICHGPHPGRAFRI